MKGRPLRQRVGFAVAGLRAAWRREASFRTHIGFAVAAAIALAVLRPVPSWWALVALTVGIVFALELLNGAVEGIVDRLHPGQHPEIGVAKNMLEGAVLVAAVAALAVAAVMVVDTMEWL